MELAGRIVLAVAFVLTVLGVIAASHFAVRRQRAGDVMKSTADSLLELMNRPTTGRYVRAVLAIAAIGAVLWLIGLMLE